MAKLKFETKKGKLAEIVSIAHGELSSLAEECREIVDNASDGLSQTQRIQTLDDTAGTLENYGDEPECPKFVSEIEIEYQEWSNARKGRGLSRSDRCSWACSLLEHACDQIEKELNKYADGTDQHDDLDAYRDELDQIKADCESLEFPGMFG